MNVNLTPDQVAFLTDVISNHLNGSHELLYDLANKLDHICSEHDIDYHGKSRVNDKETALNQNRKCESVLWVGE